MKREEKRAYFSLAKLMAAFIVIPLLVYLSGQKLCHYDQTGQGHIIYDSLRDEIIPDLSFFRWLKDQNKCGKDKRYFTAKEDIEIIDFIPRESPKFVFKAKLHLPHKKMAVKKYGLNRTRDESWRYLQNSIRYCVGSVMDEYWEPQNIDNIRIRALSVANMNNFCPLEPEYGYQWVGNLEIAQCFVPAITDPWQKEFCVNLVKHR